MRVLSTGMLCVLALSAHANVIQYFAGISYNNPSELFKVKKNTFLIGGTGSYADLRFRGNVLNFNTGEYDSGTNYSRTTTLLPYGRIATRINDSFVIGLDVTEPFNSNLNWGDTAFTKFADTQNYLTDVDISPKLSYAVNKKLYVGGGLNFNFLLNNEVNWAFPTGQFTSATLINKTSSFGLGYNLGATYMINETNFLGLTYYSRIRQNTKGDSSLGSLYSNNLLFSFSMPATTIANYVHIFSPTWLVSLQAFRTEWNANQYVRYLNTAVPPPSSNFMFDMHFDASYAFLAAVRTQFSQNLGIALIGMIDDGPEQENLRTITFPSDTQYLVGLAGDYHVNANTTIELMYGHVFSNTTINNTVKVNNASIPFTRGFVNINANVLDLKLKIEA